MSAPARGVSRASGEHREKLDEFWDRFRRAVRGRDKTAIALMTHFPFIVRWGDADPNDPTMEYNRDAFLGRLDRLLFLGSNGRLVEDAVASGGSMTTGTMLEEIAAETPHPEDEGYPDAVLLGCFQFRLVAGRWRWTTAYSTDPVLLGSEQVYPVPPVSPLRKYILDAVSEAMKLKRPLTVHHLRASRSVAYVEVQEPGRQGRLARALLRHGDKEGEPLAAWTIVKSSIRQPDYRNDGWPAEIESAIKSGVPASLFPSQRGGKVGDAH